MQEKIAGVTPFSVSMISGSCKKCYGRGIAGSVERPGEPLTFLICDCVRKAAKKHGCPDADVERFFANEIAKVVNPGEGA